MENNIEMNKKWQTTSTGTEVAATRVSVGRIWLRAFADIRPGSGRMAHFSWSADGRHFHSIGTPFVMNTDWHFFMGYRYAIFNYATKSLGGEIHVPSFKMNKN